MQLKYTLIRSNRKTMAIEISPRGVFVRAPMPATEEEIRQFVLRMEGWIRKHQAEIQQIQEPENRLTEAELDALAEKAMKVIPEKVRFYAGKLGVSRRVGRITIRNQRTKWGSCSAKGNLNFNCLLMLAPEAVLDSVVAHEVCHLVVMDHSPLFYDMLLKVFPDYWQCHRWLKEHGGELMRRMTG